MASIKIGNNKLSGELLIPPSKSMAHRAVICASLSSEESLIKNIDLSDDIIATINGMKALGAQIEILENSLRIKGINLNNKSFKEDRIIDCNESGSTLRFLIPIATLVKGTNRFIGRGNLGKRPLNKIGRAHV